MSDRLARPRESIAIPEPLQRRILAKNEAFVRARRELQELLELTQELLSVPPGYVLQDVTKGFVPVESLPTVQPTHDERDDIGGATQ